MALQPKEVLSQQDFQANRENKQMYFHQCSSPRVGWNRMVPALEMDGELCVRKLRNNKSRMVVVAGPNGNYSS